MHGMDRGFLFKSSTLNTARVTKLRLRGNLKPALNDLKKKKISNVQNIKFTIIIIKRGIVILLNTVIK